MERNSYRSLGINSRRNRQSLAVDIEYYLDLLIAYVLKDVGITDTFEKFYYYGKRHTCGKFDYFGYRVFARFAIVLSLEVNGFAAVLSVQEPSEFTRKERTEIELILDDHLISVIGHEVQYRSVESKNVLAEVVRVVICVDKSRIVGSIAADISPYSRAEFYKNIVILVRYELVEVYPHIEVYSEFNVYVVFERNESAFDRSAVADKFFDQLAYADYISCISAVGFGFTDIDSDVSAELDIEYGFVPRLE